MRRTKQNVPKIMLFYLSSLNEFLKYESVPGEVIPEFEMKGRSFTNTIFVGFVFAQNINIY